MYETLSDNNKYDKVKASCSDIFKEQGGAIDFVISKTKEVLYK